MENVKKLYREAFEKYGDSPNSVLIPKGRQKNRFDVLTSQIMTSGQNTSVLDFGCGLAHLRDYLVEGKIACNYTGVDITEEFINFNKSRHKDCSFFLLDDFMNGTEEYDYIISSGTFNIRYVTDYERHREIVLNTLERLFKRTRKAMAVDFMTDMVDFQQEGAFHESPVRIMQFFLANLTRRVIVNHSYMPYEFCIFAFKDQVILKPDNLYTE